MVQEYKVYAVIVLYNGVKWVKKCFDSLINSNIPLHIIAIDNGSTDGTVEFIKSTFPDILLIKSVENLGFGKANNIGIQKGYEEGADYFFLLNQDAWIEKDTINDLIKHHVMNSEFDILSPVHLTGAGDKLDYFFSYYLRETNTPGFTSDLFLNNLKPLYETVFVNAAAWLMSRKCVQKVGVFDEVFPHYGEDVDYIERVKYHGLKVGIASSSVIYHDREQREKIKQNHNAKHKYISNVIAAKSLKGSFAGNIVFLVKSEIDALLTDVLFRRNREASVRIKALLKLFKNLRKIHHSYHTSKKVKI